MKLKGRSAAPMAVEHRDPIRAPLSRGCKGSTSSGMQGVARGRLIMPCGTGKSLTAYWIAEGLKAKTNLAVVPSLALPAPKPD